jgi:UDP-N-acetylmuramoylalanine--D-glutamate ligase
MTDQKAHLLTARGPDIDWPSLSICVTGAGLAGVSAALHLARLGATVTVLDAGTTERQRTAADRLLDAGVRVLLGPTASAGDALPRRTDLVVTSPGFRPDSPVLLAAAADGIPVWGDAELAWRFTGDTAWLAVTGTNGKTTTTQMLAAILERSGRRSTAAGNIGVPLLDAVLPESSGQAYEVLAVELSSFQLHWSWSLRPHAAAVLNVAPDHLDWHGSPAAYAAAKARVWAGPETIAIGNADDPGSAALLAKASGVKLSFTLQEPVEGQWGVRSGVLVDGRGQDLLAASDLHAPGPHNIANALAAAALADAYGIETTVIAAALAAYTPGAHRNETVAEVGGVRYVNDSKATNPHAAAASLTAYPMVVWIAGGLNKGLPFDDLVRESAGRLRGAVLIGRCADEVAGALARHAPDVPVIRAAGMDTAVREAAGLARPGDTVLLAPAAASMDMFRDYAERGQRFAEAVRTLQEARGQ